MMKQNSKHEHNLIKISFSNLNQIETFDIQHVNIALYIQNSEIAHVLPMSLEKSSTHIELNMVNSRLDCTGWVNLLDSANLRLLSLRNIPNLIDVFKEARSLESLPLASITDLKVYNSPLPESIDDQNFLFRIITYIEQLELIGCSITEIQDNIFLQFNKAFASLRVLTMSNNNISHIGNNTFAGLNSLIILDLDHNPIEYIEANAFNRLPQLKSLSLNGNVRIVELFASPSVWLKPYLFSNVSTSLREINIKSELWLSDFCLMEEFTKFNFIAVNYTRSNRTDNQLNLINTEDISDVDDYKVYCNLKYICINQMYYSLAVWSHNDMQRICDMIGTETRQCPFYQMSKACLKRSLTSLDSKLAQMSAQSEILADTDMKTTLVYDNQSFSTRATTTKCTHKKFVFAGVRSFIIVLAFVAFVFASLTLGFFYFTYSNGRGRLSAERKMYYYEHSLDEKKTMVSQSSSESMNSGPNFDINDYYVFFLSSKQIKR